MAVTSVFFFFFWFNANRKAVWAGKGPNHSENPFHSKNIKKKKHKKNLSILPVDRYVKMLHHRLLTRPLVQS